MDKITYIAGDENLIDGLEAVWNELNEIHRDKSPFFSEIYQKRTFGDRKKQFLDYAEKGKLYTVIAKNHGETTGFCVSSLIDGKGVIESLCVSKSCRKTGIGFILMQKSIEWLKGNGAACIVLDVSVGNEEVIPFYQKFRFYPRLIELQLKEDDF